MTRSVETAETASLRSVSAASTFSFRLARWLAAHTANRAAVSLFHHCRNIVEHAAHSFKCLACVLFYGVTQKLLFPCGTHHIGCCADDGACRQSFCHRACCMMLFHMRCSPFPTLSKKQIPIHFSSCVFPSCAVFMRWVMETQLSIPVFAFFSVL